MFTKDGKIDLNKCAERIAKEEGGAYELSIAQIKEVMRLFKLDLGKFNNDLILEVIHRLSE